MTGRVIPLDGEGHRAVQALLPWYAAGRLDDADRAGVEAHLAGCADCQAELKLERRLASALADLPAPIGDVERGWAAMQAKIAAPARRASWRARLSAAWSGWRAEPAWAQWAIACQALVVVGLGAALWQTTRPEPYRALGSEEAQSRGSIVVVFKPETTEAELRAIVRASHGRLVGGPTETDAYLIAAPIEERPAALEALRSRPQVVLAEPIDAAPAP